VVFSATFLRKNTKVLGITALLIVLWVFMSVVVPESFLKGNNIENLLRRTAMYGVLGIGVAFVIISAGIDLSIGSVVCLTGCLLAMFLHVDYQPLDVQKVLAVRASQQAIVLPGEGSQFKIDDRVRYYGGRRAHTAVVTVTEVEQTTYRTQDGYQVTATVVQVDGQFSADDRYGSLAKVYEVVDFQRSNSDVELSRPSTVTIAGNHRMLAARDQVTLVHPESGIKQLTITDSQANETATRLILKDDLGAGFSKEWLAIPVARQQRMPVFWGFALVLVIGGALGLLHGLLITKLEMPPFVVTLCGLLIYRGISRWLVDDQVQGFGDEYIGSLSQLASGKLMLFSASDGSQGFGIPIPFFIFIGMAIAAGVFLKKTIWGRYMLALGRNEEAARYSGINTGRITIVAYVICTLLAALGGMLFALDSNSVSPSSFGNFFELYAIAAAVLGGCSLRGGEGGVLGVVMGTAVMQTLYNLIVLLKISDKLEFAIIGLVILLGVIADEVIRRMVAKRRAIRQAGEG